MCREFFVILYIPIDHPDLGTEILLESGFTSGDHDSGGSAIDSPVKSNTDRTYVVRFIQTCARSFRSDQSGGKILLTELAIKPNFGSLP